MRIAVVGLGKIGLPLAAQFAHKGHEVIGVDINAETVATINCGDEPFPGEAHLQEYLERLVPSGNLIATTSYADAIPGADAVVVVVPLFVDDDGQPDFGWMDSATREHRRSPHPEHFGALRDHPAGRHHENPLEAGAGGRQWSGRGHDFHLAFSPERVLTGRVFADLRKYPKLVGGLSDAGTKAARAFYEETLDFDERPDLERGNGVWDLGSAEAAEMAKLAETTYRDVNIGLANQFASFAETGRHRRLPGDRGRQLAALQPHPPSRHRRRWALHPGLPPPLPVQRPRRDRRHARPARPTPPCQGTRSTCWRRRTATSRVLASSSWAPPTAAGSRRPPFPESSLWSPNSGTRDGRDRARSALQRRRAEGARARSACAGQRR